MTYNPEIHNRKSIRLKHYDYAKQGMYFITICTKDREQILSKITVGIDAHIDPTNTNIAKNNISNNINIELKNSGKIVRKYIKNINMVYKNIYIDSYVIMPDHLHMIVCINPGSMWALTPTEKISIPKVIRSLKIMVTKEIGYSIWQRNYYEHIIRNEKEYYQIREYIKQNPSKWVGVDAHHIDPNII